MSGAVFLSHSESDRARIEPIVQLLRKSGIRVWIAPDDVAPGADYSVASDEAIESCAAFVIFVSEAAGRSRHVRAETQMAFTLNKPLFPVRMDDAPPPKGLRIFLNVQHWTNAFGRIEDRDLARLASAILESTGKEGVTAPPPPSPPPPPPSSPPRREEPKTQDITDPFHPDHAHYWLAGAAIAIVLVAAFIVVKFG